MIDRQDLGGTLGEELAEGVVGLRGRRGDGAARRVDLGGRRWRVGQQQGVAGGRKIGGRSPQIACCRRAQLAAGAARPQDEADDQADGAADRDVADPDQADLPAGRLDQVEQDDDEDGEAGLARGEVDRRGSVSRDEGGERQRQPQGLMIGPDGDHRQPADDEAEDGTGERLGRGHRGALCGRAQHRQRSQHHPEGMLDFDELGHQHRQAEREGGAQAVAAPHRVEVEMGAQPPPDCDQPGPRRGANQAGAAAFPLDGRREAAAPGDDDMGGDEQRRPGLDAQAQRPGKPVDQRGRVVAAPRRLGAGDSLEPLPLALAGLAQLLERHRVGRAAQAGGRAPQRVDHRRRERPVGGRHRRQSFLRAADEGEQAR